MQLSENEKSELLKMIDSDLFRKAMEIVAIEVSTNMASGLLAPEMAVQLSYEKGALKVPDILRRATRPGPSIARQHVPVKNSLIRPDSKSSTPSNQ